MANFTNPIVSLADMEAVTMPQTDGMARDYWQGGANELITLKENSSAFDYYKIRARCMRNVENVDMTPRKPLFGKKYSIPVGVAPSAFHQMAHSDGEVGTARACKSQNWAMGLSSYSNRSYQEVKDAGEDSAVFFQLYVFKKRNITEDLVRRVEKAGYKALALTVDTPYLGRRYSEIRNKFCLPSYLGYGNFPEKEAPDFEAAVGGMTGSTNNEIDPSICWEETIPWLRSITNMEIWVKGVVTEEDTELAIQAGVDGIWVSNHGGRQLDSGLATIDALPEVVKAAGGRVPVHVDGGIRRGGDVFKALALGADFVWLGRPVLWGLKYDGQAGVEKMMGIVTEDFKSTMALAGCHSVDEINPKTLVRIGPSISKL
ncbi:FMN-dependent alpha-hydroxy acid dehydrogenase [Nadsonia fulvescens var. elongata DSM 6958]|uniref:Oxidase FUB9 n=1 Tax=Nadsonia fulvescens var. elongata DSM 6958 TaxID=857566 RepID=A0A1E3PKA0_9ASCO|nr:FMN-dependent alpha-hydroxy acid dehydrogenase [Nadsonia fulvescens var. elongata DSM 6958]